ncbi:MAG: hypothetical protein ACK55Z_20545 [bacterium]
MASGRGRPPFCSGSAGYCTPRTFEVRDRTDTPAARGWSRRCLDRRPG